MKTDNSNRHLTLEERQIIENGIKDGLKKSKIAAMLGKDKSTIGKEIRKHRTFKHSMEMKLECEGYRKCSHGRECTADCPDYIPFTCSRRDRSPGACNGCGQYSRCRFNKYHYSAQHAHNEYLSTLSDSRAGVNLTSKEAQELADIVAPLLRQGHSPYQIVADNSNLGICERTLYNYIDAGIFHYLGGVTNLDLRRKTGRKISKRKTLQYRKRDSKAYLKGRTYSDYTAFMEENSDAFVTQMDTVYNDESEGPFVQTFKFMHAGVMIGILHSSKTAEEMTGGIDMLEQVLGKDVFSRYCSVILTDRGTEFSDAEGIEKDRDGRSRARIFYCDPMRSNQKGSLENNHIELRYILPKGKNLNELGLTCQEALNTALSHINSSSHKKLGGKSPLEAAEFMYPDLYEKLTEFGIVQIGRNSIILNPSVLRDFREEK